MGKVRASAEAAGGRRRTWALTRGVPLYVREVARAATDQGVLAPAGGIWQWRGKVAGSARLTDLVGDQLRRAGPDVRRVVDLTAFGEPLPRSNPGPNRAQLARRRAALAGGL